MLYTTIGIVKCDENILYKIYNMGYDLDWVHFKRDFYFIKIIGDFKVVLNNIRKYSLVTIDEYNNVVDENSTKHINSIYKYKHKFFTNGSYDFERVNEWMDRL